MSVLFRHFVRLFPISSAPTGTGEGDLWYRSDVDQVHSSDGGAGLPLTIGPVGNLPVVRTTAWHTLPPFGNASSANVPADRLFALPFWPGRSCTLTAVATNVTLALVGGNLRMGVYLSDGSVPTALLADYGTVGSGVNGVRSITGLSTALRPVLHYLVIARQGGVLNLGLSSRDTWDPIVSDTSAVLDSNRSAYYRDTVSGALPDPFGSIAGTVQGPSMSVQLT